MESIHNFQTNIIAFWRPHKHTYHALTWNNASRHWRTWVGVVEGGLSKHKSTVHPTPGSVDIKLINNNMVRIRAEGEFLMLGNTRITVVKRIGGATIPNAWKNHELGPLIERAGVDLAISLWDLPPAAQPAVPSTVSPMILGTVLEPIPKRIAWLVAEDAAKNNEKCPITMDPISPITASVTSCFHSFDSEAIASWLINHSTCPQCRKNCVATVAYTEA
jgi:hypothetical protein